MTNKIKSLIFSFILIISSFTIGACVKSPDPVVLDTPGNFQVVENYLTWQPVPYANGYNVKIVQDNSVFTVVEPRALVLPMYTNQLIAVQATPQNANYLESAWSNPYLVLAGSTTYPVALDTPGNFQIVDNYLTWQPVSNAYGYNVKVVQDNSVFTVVEPRALVLPKYNNQLITVQAISQNANYLESAWSNPYLVLLKSSDPVTLETPDNFQVVENYLTWQPVSNANGYNVKIVQDNTVFFVAETRALV
ncbi:hypothetical protein EZS27_018025 [termite gut metagenome]|uniref:Uncharacterized protein n=1 Tax=termite gut metagenome TaxID=433724 RepID=A0A5J4RIY0_9ZZZZ